MDLTNAQWEVREPLIPDPVRRADGRGRPWRDSRSVLNQDGRKLRRYKRRWKIERLFAWLGNFRRLVVRYERKVENYLGLVRLGCIVILLRYL